MPIKIRGTNFVYFPSPKCGSTSLKTALLHHEKVFAGREITTPMAHNFPGYKSEWWQRKNWLQRPFVRPFCVVRDPIERFVSGYREQVVARRKMPGGEVPDLNTFAFTFDQCTDDHIHYHFAPLVTILGSHPAYYHRVFRLREIAQVPDYLGIPLKLTREQRSMPTAEVLSVEATNRLREFYAADYRAWGRYF